MESIQKKLQECVSEFEKEDLDYYNAVQQTFHNYPNNIDVVAVAIKFSVLNQLYSTVIFDKDRMISHIHNLAAEENLDSMLQKGDLEAINKIRFGHGILTQSKNERDNYSFATKYCHFSNPKCYPVYDQYVFDALIDLLENNYIKFQKEDLKKPQEFEGAISQVIKLMGFTDLKDYQKVDRALWIYGQYIDGELDVPGLPKVRALTHHQC
ncbi:MAG: hypothetical protein ABSA75_13660 [Candidatus Bathyarchaeia archaeon]